MITNRRLLPWTILVLICGGCAEPTSPRAAVAPIFTVAEFDPSADAARDLAATVAQAQASGKRILLEVGGRW